MKLLKRERFDILFAIYIACAVLANVMGAKVMPLGTFFGMQFNISVAIILMPILFSIVDAVCEVYSKKQADSMVRAGILSVAFMTLFAMFAVAMPAAERFTAVEAYNQVFAVSIRFGVASLTAFALSTVLDVLIYSKLKAKHGEGRLIWLRNNASNFVGQFVDSAVFVMIAFYSPAMSASANLNWMFGIIIPLTLAKCVMSVVTTPAVYAAVKFLKGKKEKKDDIQLHSGEDAGRPAAA